MTSSNDILYSCVNSLNASVELLNESLKLLDETTKNVPRLKKVLRTQKVFGLVPESDLEDAAKNAQEDLQPQISALMGRLETEMSRLRRKKVNLTNKVELQRVRLEAAGKNTSFDRVKGISTRRLAKGDLDEQKLARLRLLQDKKDRLKYTLSRLKLQDNRARLSTVPSLPPQ